MTHLLLFLFGWIEKVPFVKKFLKWSMSSFEESSERASGKAYCAFTSMMLIIYIVVQSVRRNQELHTETLIILTSFISALYGIKTASKYFNSNGTNSNTTTALTDPNPAK